jgi:hypothetical protein
MMMAAAETTTPPTKRQRREARRRFRDAQRTERHQATRAPLGPVTAATRAVQERDRERAAAHPRKLTKSALERLLERGTISQAQHDAGERLYRDWHLSGSSPRIIAALSPGRLARSDTSEDVSATIIDARRRFEGAVLATGRRSLDVVVHVCLTPQTGPADWDAIAHRRKGTGNELLREGLDRLAKWYGG